MLVVLRPGALARVLAVTAVVAGLLALLLGNGLTEGPAGTPGQTSPAPVPTGDRLTRTTPSAYRVVGTAGSGLNVRSCAASTCRRVGWLGEGVTFQADCWLHGTAVSGDDRWLHGTANGHTGFAAAHFLRGGDAPECGADAARES
ncbi:hypothetical protein ACIOD2_49125 [Amycolatopsis sp. NPDC088138]|uniref:hypothetical protein n=1 Tax=Amycolatopsis sp. NPDC088138 TaxID=3363938 RepID=UPI003805D02A